MSQKVDAIAKFIRENSTVRDADLKHAIEEKWLGITVDLHRNNKQEKVTVFQLHNAACDNVLIAMIDRDTVQ